MRPALRDHRLRLVVRDRALVVWAGLVLATVVSALVGSDVTETGALHGVALTVLGLGFLKARFIGLDFMALRTAPRWLRGAFEAWIVVVFVFLVVMFEVTSG